MRWWSFIYNFYFFIFYYIPLILYIITMGWRKIKILLPYHNMLLMRRKCRGSSSNRSLLQVPRKQLLQRRLPLSSAWLTISSKHWLCWDAASVLRKMLNGDAYLRTAQVSNTSDFTILALNPYMNSMNTSSWQVKTEWKRPNTSPWWLRKRKLPWKEDSNSLLSL